MQDFKDKVIKAHGASCRGGGGRIVPPPPGPFRGKNLWMGYWHKLTWATDRDPWHHGRLQGASGPGCSWGRLAASRQTDRTSQTWWAGSGCTVWQTGWGVMKWRKKSKYKEIAASIRLATHDTWDKSAFLKLNIRTLPFLYIYNYLLPPPPFFFWGGGVNWIPLFIQCISIQILLAKTGDGQLI